MKLYEVLIPRADNEKNIFSRAHNLLWQEEVRKSAGGLSLCPAIEGQWENGGKVYREKMIPVRIACSAKNCKISQFCKIAFPPIVDYVLSGFAGCAVCMMRAGCNE